MKFSDNFKEAVQDYLWLLNKNYPQKKVLTLVGDRYRLLKTERSILYRGISPTTEAAKHQKKLRKLKEKPAETLHVDMLNVLITVVSYLAGKPVFICSDGWLRDAAEMHAGIIAPHLLEKGIDLLLNFALDKTEVKSVWYIDQKAEAGKEALQFLENKNKDHIQVYATESADHILKKVEEGALATSDTQLLAKSPCPVIDLPRELLEDYYSPDFIDLRHFV
ncbi:MAG: DUF434 domain-containing protein [Bacteroidales bacterium]|nr:DUF434 domain-containing protein [Bacteroidales bacterium]MCF8333956.1 DUF434 domain-containing protein [Bacteroidales bacterium]